MPFCAIPPSSLEHLSLFGYDMIAETETGAWYHGPLGRTWIEKDKPVVWVEDTADAIQLGAVAINVTHPLN